MERTLGRHDAGGDPSRAEPTAPLAARRASWTGVVAGIGLMGALDEILFHQLLQWHHFYAHTTAYWQVFSDGLFHLFTASMFFAAVMLLWAQRRSFASVLRGAPFWSGFLLGAGAFQLFDGIVNHKLLGLHQVRMGADPLWPYDLGWIASGAAPLLVGLWLRGRGTT